MNVCVPHELYRTPRLRQAARTLVASGGRHGNRKRLTANASNSSERAEQIKEQYRIPLQKHKTSFITLKDVAAIRDCGAVETETILKTRAILKSHKSKGNLNFYLQ